MCDCDQPPILDPDSMASSVQLGRSSALKAAMQQCAGRVRLVRAARDSGGE